MKFCFFSYETCHHHLFQANCGGGGWGAEASNKSFDENWIFTIFVWNVSFHQVNQFHFFIQKSLSTESVLTQSRRGKSIFPSLVVLVTWYIFLSQLKISFPSQQYSHQEFRFFHMKIIFLSCETCIMTIDSFHLGRGRRSYFFMFAVFCGCFPLSYVLFLNNFFVEMYASTNTSMQGVCNATVNPMFGVYWR